MRSILAFFCFTSLTITSGDVSLPCLPSSIFPTKICLYGIRNRSKPEIQWPKKKRVFNKTRVKKYAFEKPHWSFVSTLYEMDHGFQITKWQIKQRKTFMNSCSLVWDDDYSIESMTWYFQCIANIYPGCTHSDMFQPDSSCCSRGYFSNSWEIPHQPYTNPVDQKSHTCTDTTYVKECRPNPYFTNGQWEVQNWSEACIGQSRSST